MVRGCGYVWFEFFAPGRFKNLVRPKIHGQAGHLHAHLQASNAVSAASAWSRKAAWLGPTGDSPTNSGTGASPLPPATSSRQGSGGASAARTPGCQVVVCIVLTRAPFECMPQLFQDLAHSPMNVKSRLSATTRMRSRGCASFLNQQTD